MYKTSIQFHIFKTGTLHTIYTVPVLSSGDEDKK